MASTSSSCQEFTIRVPKNTNKRFNLMRFRESANVDVAQWSQVKMGRENDTKDIESNKDNPKFGAGSEYGRERREEARRLKNGISLKKSNPDDQPWILKTGGKAGKMYKGTKEGSVASNTSYYVFIQTASGVMEAYPVEDWYSFKPMMSYNTLSSEEAEEKFVKRDRFQNYFQIMKKRLNLAEGAEDENNVEKTQKKTEQDERVGKLKIFDGGDLEQKSDNESEESEDDEEGERKNKRKPKKNAKGKKGKKKIESDDKEDLCDGDNDGLEHDYISGSDESMDEELAVICKAVEDEDAIRKFGEPDSEDENKEEEKENTETKEETAANNEIELNEKAETSDTKDSDADIALRQSLLPDSKKSNNGRNSASDAPKGDNKKRKLCGESNCQSPPSKHKKSKKSVANKNENKAEKYRKRKRSEEDFESDPPAKKPKSQAEPQIAAPSSSTSNEGISEETIRRYLITKPMTMVEILRNVRNKQSNLSRQQCVNGVAEVLKRLNPEKQKVNGKLYLSLKQN